MAANTKDLIQDIKGRTSNGHGHLMFVAHIVITLAASYLLAGAMAPAFGFVLPGVKTLSWTEAAYAMGAYYLYRKGTS